MHVSPLAHEFGAHCRLGESPIWVSEQSTLYWADIKSERVHSLRWPDKTHRIFQLGIAVTAIARRGSESWITATTTGLYAWDWEFETKEFLLDPCAEIDGVRLNDAVVDREGRLWTGSLNQNDLPAPDGALYRIDPDRSVHQLDSGFSVANGITFSPAGDRLYVSNMLKGQVFVYDMDAKSGDLSNKRVFATVPEIKGFPDGLTVDKDGFVWICHWKGRCVTRHDPITGEVETEVALPVSNIARATFMGPNLDQLVITTAWHAMEADLPNQPLAGDLFSVGVPVAGLAEELFRG